MQSREWPRVAISWDRAIPALVPQVVDAVSVPVVAAGGIAGGRGIAAAFALGAAGTQIGTAYLLCPEAATPSLYRDALRQAGADTTLLTNVFTGRPARILVYRLALEVGPISDALPDFPLPMGELAPLRAMAEQKGNSDFTPLKASTFDSIHEASLKRVLVPTDFSLGADNALEYAVRLSKFKQAEIFLLHVFNLAEYLSVLSQETDVDPKTAERVLEAAATLCYGEIKIVCKRNGPEKFFVKQITKIKCERVV